MTFGEKLGILRTECGYSQEGLAEQLGVSRQAISKWEMGTTVPELDKVIAISDFFGVSTDYLLKEHMELNHSGGLDRAVIRFLGSAQEMDEISKDLIDIVQDGTISDAERRRIDDIVDTLDAITSIINEIKRKMNTNSTSGLRKDVN